MNRSASPSRWAFLVLALATLALGGCGRKGGLDLPPGAAAAKDTEAAAQQAEVEPAKGGLFDPSFGANAPPVASKGRKKAFVLDPLLND